MKKALITGITGQDGAYLSELLLEKGYQVHGIKRRTSLINTDRIDHLYQPPQVVDHPFIMHHGDMTDSSSLIRIIQEVQPTEVYNLAAQSHVAVSFEAPEYTAHTDATGALRLLEAIRIVGLGNTTKYYQASTSELYGKVQEKPQTERTPFYPRSPYAVAKLYAYWITVNYREAYDMFACNGILFNHESPLRGETFVTRKISRFVANLFLGNENCLYIGNLNSMRDWGHAKDYVYAMWLMLQQETPDDFVVATGQQYSVREFIENAFNHLEIAIEWKGIGIEEIGIAHVNGDCRKDLDGEVVVRIDPKYFRPTEVDDLLGDASKAYEKLGWKPNISFSELVKEMVESDIEAIKLNKKFFVHQPQLVS